MKTLRNAALALMALGALAGPAAASTSIAAGLHVGPSGYTSIDLGFFYDDLAPYGNWIERPQYGWVFVPVVADSWRPYEEGHWELTDYGWTWISDEPFGWATYHYGRWYDDPEYGWGWVPDDEWGPAWVSWQEGGGYAGWAPLPPRLAFRPGVTLSVSLAPEAYVFVPESRFLARRVGSYAVPIRDCGRIYRNTRNYTRYSRYRDRYDGYDGYDGYINEGLSVERVRRAVGRSVPRYRVADLSAGQRRRAHIANHEVGFFRPRVERSRVAPPPERRIARRSVVTERTASFKGNRKDVRGGRFADDRRSAKVSRQKETRIDRRQVRSTRELRGPGQSREVRSREVRKQVKTRELRGSARSQEVRKQVRTREIRRPARSSEVRKQVRTREIRRPGRSSEVRKQVRTRETRRTAVRQERRGRQPAKAIRSSRVERRTEIRQRSRPAHVTRHDGRQREARPARQTRSVRREVTVRKESRQVVRNGGRQDRARHQARPGRGDRPNRHGQAKPHRPPGHP